MITALVDGLYPFFKDLLFVGKGVFVTLYLFGGSFLVGIVLGSSIALLRYRKIAVNFLDQGVSLLRGTPLILQLGMLYYAFPSLLGLKFSVLTTGIITFGINSSAYIAEILKSGIEALPKGQFEAAQALHIPVFYMWKDIIIPQLLRNNITLFVHEGIALLKETALIATLGGMDLMRSAQVLASEHFTFFGPYILAGFYYYILVLCFESLGRFIARKNTYN